MQCDASSYGLGGVLLQSGKPVYYASRSLTTAEQNYSQIEKEALAIQFSTQRFHDYVYGRKIQVISDHRPLESIFKKTLLNAPKRLQRILMNLSSYDLEVVWQPGTSMLLADQLSRAVSKRDEEA